MTWHLEHAVFCDSRIGRGIVISIDNASDCLNVINSRCIETRSLLDDNALHLLFCYCLEWWTYLISLTNIPFIMLSHFLHPKSSIAALVSVRVVHCQLYFWKCGKSQGRMSPGKNIGCFTRRALRQDVMITPTALGRMDQHTRIWRHHLSSVQSIVIQWINTKSYDHWYYWDLSYLQCSWKD